MSIRNLSLLFLFFIISRQAFSKITTEVREDSKLINVVVDNIEIKKIKIQNHEFEQVKLIGVEEMEAVHYEVGAPMVPVLRFFVEAQSESDIKVNFIQNSKKQTFFAHNIAPIMPSLEKIPGAQYPQNDLKVRKNFLNIPSEKYTVQETGSVAGQKRYLVTLYPLEYKNGSIHLERDFKIEIINQASQFIPMKSQEGIVFIIAKKFQGESSLITYMDLKRKLGFDVYSLVVNNPSPDSLREKIRSLYIRNPNIKYALIVGDADDIPGYGTKLLVGTTDHYYASLSVDYSTDINSPDISIGRITPKSSEELKNILQKFTNYLEEDYSRQDMFKYVSFIATDDQYEVAEATHDYVQEKYTVKASYRGIFPAANELGGDRLYAVANGAEGADVVRSMQQGRTIINYSGHGATDSWAGPIVSQDDVRSMKSNTYPFVISNACITGYFIEDEAFAETWIKHRYGAIAFWGSMDSTYWDEDDILERRMYDGIFTKNLKTFGEITDYALSEMWRYYGGEGFAPYYRETYHIFGDPSIKLKIAPF